MLTSAFNCYGAENDTLKWHLEFILLTFCYAVPMDNEKRNTFFIRQECIVHSQGQNK